MRLDILNDVSPPPRPAYEIQPKESREGVLPMHPTLLRPRWVLSAEATVGSMGRKAEVGESNIGKGSQGR